MNSAEEALKKAYNKHGELAQSESEASHCQLIQHLEAFQHLCDNPSDPVTRSY